MLNEKKIRLMNKLALYEEKEGRNDLRLNHYYKTDYIRFQLSKSLLSVTIGFGLILVLLAIYKAEYLIAEAVKLDYKLIGSTILGIYIVTMLSYSLFAVILYSIQYDYSKKKTGKYVKELKELQQFYKNNDT